MIQEYGLLLFRNSGAQIEQCGPTTITVNSVLAWVSSSATKLAVPNSRMGPIMHFFFTAEIFLFGI